MCAHKYIYTHGKRTLILSFVYKCKLKKIINLIINTFTCAWIFYVRALVCVCICIYLFGIVWCDVDASPFIAYFHESFTRFLPRLSAFVCACTCMCVYFCFYRHFYLIFFSLSFRTRSWIALIWLGYYSNQHQQKKIKCFKLYSFIFINCVFSRSFFLKPLYDVVFASISFFFIARVSRFSLSPPHLIFRNWILFFSLLFSILSNIFLNDEQNCCLCVSVCATAFAICFNDVYCFSFFHVTCTVIAARLKGNFTWYKSNFTRTTCNRKCSTNK